MPVIIVDTTVHLNLRKMRPISNLLPYKDSSGYPIQLGDTLVSEHYGYTVIVRYDPKFHDVYARLTRPCQRSLRDIGYALNEGKDYRVVYSRASHG